MDWPASPLGQALATFAADSGVPVPNHPAGAFAMVVWQVVGYPAEDTRQWKGFSALIDKVGLDARAILAASDEPLQAVTRAGGAIAAPLRAQRLRETARRVMEAYGGDVDQVLKLPAAKARKALANFPMIGLPVADKILLFCGAAASLAPDSNALRVLIRLGLIEASGGYSKEYRAANALAAEQLGDDIDRLQAAHLILRGHGMTVCKRSGMDHSRCPLADRCLDRGTPNG